VEFEFIAGDVSLDFINTRAGPVPHPDVLNSYRDLADWSAQAGAISASQRASLVRLAEEKPRAAGAVFRNAIHLRECLCRLVLALMERRAPSPDDLRAFNGFLSQALSNLELQPAPGGYRLQRVEAHGRLDSLLWPLASAASQVLASDLAQSIRQCDAETCRWFFIDRSKNRSRRWCDMKVCGNRAKARKFYRQQKSQS
jgi:predicted RNA-binding Zn ribbon-like protein